MPIFSTSKIYVFSFIFEIRGILRKRVNVILSVEVLFEGKLSCTSILSELFLNNGWKKKSVEYWNASLILCMSFRAQDGPLTGQ